MQSRARLLPRPAALAPLVLSAIALIAPGAGMPARAQQATLEGAWAGSGTVELPSGATERARCRATFRRTGDATFSMSALCATQSTRVAQTANLERASSTRFIGDFFNSEYGVGGSIIISVRGNALSATLQAGGGSAKFNLSR